MISEIRYSSLGYLRSFPFDRIKIDQSFVRGSSNDAVGRAIVRAIASLGQSLGMATVAEGVETEEQMARIVSDGCTDVQGNLISRPIPPEQIGSFLLSRNETVFRDEADNLASPDHASALSAIRPRPRAEVKSARVYPGSPDSQ